MQLKLQENIRILINYISKYFIPAYYDIFHIICGIKRYIIFINVKNPVSIFRGDEYNPPRGTRRRMNRRVNDSTLRRPRCCITCR